MMVPSRPRLNPSQRVCLQGANTPLPVVLSLVVYATGLLACQVSVQKSLQLLPVPFSFNSVGARATAGIDELYVSSLLPSF